jgi:3-hydroxyisobutyrate dehydrogenase-like beta-hydroxyacid dehydrogenase
MTDVTVIGLGNMGRALALCLAKSGRSMTVWNRTPRDVKELQEAGARVADTLATAIAASDLIVTCVKSHGTTESLLCPLKSAIAGKTIVELSTGGAAEATSLAALFDSAQVRWQIGMINAYPSGIGKPDTAILCAGPRDVWDACAATVKTLGGASAHVGTSATAVPGLFAAMFTARQGFMFGLIYGGAVCRKAGLPMEVFAEQVPVTLGMAGNYAELFRRSVPSRAYDNSEAPVSVYLAALDDALATFVATGTRDELPRLMRDLAKAGMDEGLESKELTSLVEMLAQSNTKTRTA